MMLKGWKVTWRQGAAAGLGLVSAGVLLWRLTLPRELPMATTMMMVDITTGQLFEMDVGNGLMAPERNPETGALTLAPVEQDGRGEWYISSRVRGELGMAEGDMSAVEPDTGRVTVNGRGVRRARPGRSH